MTLVGGLGFVLARAGGSGLQKRSSVPEDAREAGRTRGGVITPVWAGPPLKAAQVGGKPRLGNKRPGSRGVRGSFRLRSKEAGR